MKLRPFLFTCLLILACFMVGCQDKKEIENAKQKLNEYCLKLPTSSYQASNRKYMFDVTEDGTDDLCTSVFFGSGMPRVAVVVYDYVNDKFYNLDGFLMNYRIDAVKNDRLEIVAYTENKEQSGTVKFENDALTFVPD